jgi:hypothetical protein
VCSVYERVGRGSRRHRRLLDSVTCMDHGKKSGGPNKTYYQHHLTSVYLELSD